MSETELKSFLKDTINEIAFTEVDEDESLFNSKLIDSISFVDLLVAIEDAMNIKIKVNEVNTDNFDTISQIAKFIQLKVNES